MLRGCRRLVFLIVLLLLLAAAGLVTIGIGWWRARGLVDAEMAKVDGILRPSELPPGYVDMLLRVEDPSFYEHRGIDLRTPGAGMTTIPQGEAKFLYFDHFQPGIQKIPQSLYAIGLDLRISKSEILTLFLNRAYMGTIDGRHIRGFEEAAEAYFGKRAPQLDREQWLALVAMPLGPDHYNVAKHPENNRERVVRIEHLLAGDCAPASWLDVEYRKCGAPSNPPK